MHALGYKYDSSLRGSGDAYVSDLGVVHFPVHIMDCDVFNLRGRFQSVHFKEALDMTKKSIEEHFALNTNYVSIIFHDRYFSSSHSAWRDWYMAVLDWLISQRISTCTYDEATLSLLNIKIN